MTADVALAQTIAALKVAGFCLALWLIAHGAFFLWDERSRP